MDQQQLNELAAMTRDAEKLVGKGKAKDLFAEMQRVNLEAAESRPAVVRRPSKPGKLRNKPCPCGSGIKFKKCCMDKEI